MADAFERLHGKGQSVLMAVGARTPWARPGWRQN
jgi:hypothetical protein